MDLNTPVKDAGRIYKNYAKRLEKLEIFKLKDFLFHLPSRYDDFSLISKINKLQEGEIVTIVGQITEIKNQYTRSHKQIQKATVTDETGEINIIWFNQPFITKTLNFGDKVSMSGRVESDGYKLTLNSPAFEVVNNDQTPIHTGRLVPVYPETAGVSSKWLRRQIYKLLSTSSFEEVLPEDIVRKENLMDFKDAIRQIHFPNNLQMSVKARERLAFDEVFSLQLEVMKRKSDWQKNLKGPKIKFEKYKSQIEKFWDSLPFELTNSQLTILHEIFKDFEKEKSMNRLLQGDVGSGKTVVATIAMYLGYLNGFQSVLMAPTEILAMQHYNTISNLLEPLGVKVELRTGSINGIKNKELGIKKGSKSHILIGTHAVLSENVKLSNLGFVVIDEQQRFGVEQRSAVRQKGQNPHFLTMTATPIPRTVALTLYGDLDLSILSEMPKGRIKIKTWLVPEIKRKSAYEWIESNIKNNGQAFIVCPFIEESESITTVKAATKEFENLQKTVFPKLSLGLLHGKLKSKEKDEILSKFKNKKIDILVATPVVEVGIDIPDATIIVIEAAERFGLSQLHQLRGRVGRSDKESFCLLFTDSKNPQTLTRLKAMERMHNGAQLSQLDLELRGAGELYGTLQHGTRWLKIADFSDLHLIEKAKREASLIYPELIKYPKLQEKLEEISIGQVSPD